MNHAQESASYTCSTLIISKKPPPATVIQSMINVIKRLIFMPRSCGPPRYASMLEVTMDPHKPHVCDIPAEDLVSFCHDR